MDGYSYIWLQLYMATAIYGYSLYMATAYIWLQLIYLGDG